MLHRSAMLKAYTAVLFLVAITTNAWAQPAPGTVNEAAFLGTFNGHFTGTGRLERADGSRHTLTCEFNGNSVGRRAVLDGRCSTAIIFGISMRIVIRYDGDTRRYLGSYHESTGTIAVLAGSRQGATLSLSFTETAESIRPNPPARLMITRRDRDVVFALRRTKPGRGQNLDLVLRQS